MQQVKGILKSTTWSQCLQTSSWGWSCSFRYFMKCGMHLALMTFRAKA